MDLFVAEASKVGRPRGKSRKPTLPGFYSEEEQAERLGISVVQLRRWRRASVGPKSVRCGRRELYPHGGDEKWLAEKLASAETKPALRGRGRPRTA
jgi:hypothetical protein